VSGVLFPRTFGVKVKRLSMARDVSLRQGKSKRAICACTALTPCLCIRLEKITHSPAAPCCFLLPQH